MLIYRLRTRARAEGRTASLFSPAPAADGALWLAYVREHLPSVEAPAELPTEQRSPLPRPTVFLGAQGVLGPRTLGVGTWGAKLFVGPATPFALGVTGGAAYARSGGVGNLGATVNLSLLLPLVRRFTIGAAPAGLHVVCDTHFNSCAPDAVATLGVLIVPLGTATWLAFEGPRWSWTKRTISDSWLGLSFGWSHERVPRRELPGAEAVASWDPPRPDEVRAFRHTRSTRAIYLATTAVSGPDNRWLGVGLDWRLDRDIWDRRAGFAPGVQVEVDGGRIDQPGPGGVVAIAPTLRAYLMPNRLAVTATPALVRVGALAGDAVGVDVAGRAGIALELGRLELAVDSPPLSYLSRARWHALPISFRLGMRLD